MENSEIDMHHYYEIYDAFGDQAANEFLEKNSRGKEVGNMSEIEKQIIVEADEGKTTEPEGFPKAGSKELQRAIIREMMENETGIGIGAGAGSNIDPDKL